MPRRPREGYHVSFRTITERSVTVWWVFLLHSSHRNSGVALLQHLHGSPRISSHPCFSGSSLAVAPLDSSLKQYSKTYSERVMALTKSVVLHSSSNIQHDVGSVDPPPERNADDMWAAALPDSPKARQKAFNIHLMQFVKAGDAEGALRLYGAVRELRCHATEGMFNAVLSLCGDGTTICRGKRVLSDMEAAGFMPKENSYSFLLREAAGRGAFDEAFSILRDMTQRGVAPRLRSYAPVLRGLCDEPDMSLAVEVWSHMREHGVQPLEQDYLLMIKGWAQSKQLWGRVRDSSVERLLRELSNSAFELSPANHVEPVRNTTNATIPFLDTLLEAFNCNSGSDTATPAIARIASVSPRPGEGGAFCDCCGGRLGAVGLSDDERLRVRSALKSLAAESLLHGQAGGGAAAAVDPAEEGSEGNGGAREREEVVEETERSEVVEGLGDRPRKRGRPVALTAPIGGLDHFAGWLEERQREPSGGFTTVIDGCNIAYYGQNVEGGHVRMLQVDQVVKMLEAESERVLVVFPDRYLRTVVVNSSRFKGVKNAPTKLSSDALKAIEEWEERGMLYRCANGADDDLFWMYFTVASDGAVAPNCVNGNISVSECTVANDRVVDGSDRCATSITPGGNFVASRVEDGRLAVNREGTNGSSSGGGRMEEVLNGGIKNGINTVASTDCVTSTRLTVVSNDEMRNHRMALLEPVPFRRWRNSQVRGFHLQPMVRNMSTATNDDSREEGSAQDNDQQSELSDRAPPRKPVVLGVPSFTRDMQVVDRAWHIPIMQDTPGVTGSKWLCINLTAGLHQDERYGPSSSLPEDHGSKSIESR